MLSFPVLSFVAWFFLLSHFFSLFFVLQFLSVSKSCYFRVSHDHRSYERNLSNCVEKPEKVRTSTGFEPVKSCYFRRINSIEAVSCFIKALVQAFAVLQHHQ